MTMPRFTAEASLYETNGHYRTGMQVIKLSVQTIIPIRPALREQEGEVIHVHSCPPGFSDIGGSCWPNPLTEPTGSRGGNSGGFGEIGVGGGPRGGGVSGGKPPKNKPKPPLRPPRDYHPKKGDTCHVVQSETTCERDCKFDDPGDVTITERLNGTYAQDSTNPNLWFCAGPYTTRVWRSCQ